MGIVGKKAGQEIKQKSQSHSVKVSVFTHGECVIVIPPQTVFVKSILYIFTIF